MKARGSIEIGAYVLVYSSSFSKNIGADKKFEHLYL